jgi:hypothetical protein
MIEMIKIRIEIFGLCVDQISMICSHRVFLIDFGMIDALKGENKYLYHPDDEYDVKK